MTHKTKGQRGAAAVEFALVLPVLVLLLLGILEFGRLYQVQTTLSQAARVGVRTMAVKNDAGAARTAAQNAAPTLAVAGSQIAVTPGSCSSGGTASVVITYPYHFLTGMFGAAVTLTGKGVMQCGG